LNFYANTTVIIFRVITIAIPCQNNR